MRGPGAEENNFGMLCHTCLNNNAWVGSCPSLQATDSVKYLSVMINRHFSFKSTLSNYKKEYVSLYIFSKI